MPIDIGGQFLETSSDLSYVVEDIYVKGGYRVVTVDSQTWTDANGDVNDQFYQTALADAVAAGSNGSIKLGCLVFDNTSGRNFRCTAAPPSAVTFTEVFANDGSIDESRFVQRTELPQDANGAIDIASEATLQEALLSSVRVASNGTTNLVLSQTSEPTNNNLLRLQTTPSDGTSQAYVQLIVNTAAFGGDPNSA